MRQKGAEKKRKTRRYLHKLINKKTLNTNLVVHENKRKKKKKNRKKTYTKTRANQRRDLIDVAGVGAKCKHSDGVAHGLGGGKRGT